MYFDYFLIVKTKKNSKGGGRGTKFQGSTVGKSEGGGPRKNLKFRLVTALLLSASLKVANFRQSGLKVAKKKKVWKSPNHYRFYYPHCKMMIESRSRQIITYTHNL